MELVHKLLPLLFLVVLVLTVFFYQPLKRHLAYSLNLDNDPTASCCDEAKILASDGEFDESESLAIFNGDPVTYPKTSLAQADILPNPGETQVLGTQSTDGSEKWIEVSLTEQKLRAWEGNNIVMEFPISSGKWSATPKGDYHIWYKTRSQKMEGGSKELGTYYYLPNVPHNMFFYKGYAIHGAYWHNNFGTPMSHGCVNAPLSQVSQLFEWAGPVVPAGTGAVRASLDNPGTRVFVH